MDLPEATRIARHHLGDTLHRCYRGGAHADVWCVEATYQGEYYLGCAPTPEAAAVAVATQLRAAGWVPTHARLEWFESSQSSRSLYLRVGPRLHHEILSVSWISDRYRVEDSGIESQPAGTREDVLAWVDAHVGWLELSLHLPPFPGDKP